MMHALPRGNEKNAKKQCLSSYQMSNNKINMDKIKHRCVMIYFASCLERYTY